MIVAFRIDPALAAALRMAARPDEDVVAGAGAAQALREGFPRLAVRVGGAARDDLRDGGGDPVPALVVESAAMEAWKEVWRADGLPRPWPTWLADRLAPRIGALARPVWVDRTLADLGALVGRPLPRALAGLGRRVLEYPGAYVDLRGLEGLSGLSAGALKARFRRRGMASPFSYLRWFRAIAAAHALTESGATVATAAARLGWTGTGNLFRHVRTTTGFVPSTLRADGAREKLLIRFVGEHLGDDALASWEALDRLFLRRRA